MPSRQVAADPDGAPPDERGAGPRPFGWRQTDWMRLASERPELAALVVRERAHTFRTIVCALALVAIAGVLIPIATARPRYRPGSAARS